jgi:acyl-CoA synthetase (AMP-forming)/AMP-acid ligase II
MISHRNVIANTLQYRTFEAVARKEYGIETQVVMGLLPFSHIYGLVVVAHAAVWAGDEVIVLPKFDLTDYLQAIERFKVNHVPVVRHLCLFLPRCTSLMKIRSPQLLSVC